MVPGSVRADLGGICHCRMCVEWVNEGSTIRSGDFLARVAQASPRAGMCIGGRLRRHGQAPAAASEPVPDVTLHHPSVLLSGTIQVSLALLTGVVASIRIVDFVAEVIIKQRFENSSSSAIEAIYELLIDPKVTSTAKICVTHSIYQSAVCRFRIEVDGKVYEGKMMEKQSARDAYGDGLAQGHGSYQKPYLCAGAIHLGLERGVHAGGEGGGTSISVQRLCGQPARRKSGARDVDLRHGARV